MERHCDLRGDGDGRPARRAVLFANWPQRPGRGHYGGCAGGYPLRAAPRSGEGGERQSNVVSRGARAGVALRHGAGPASAGFGVIATFITLFYDAKGWDGAAFALTLFSCAFVGARLLFPNAINRLGGLNVAMLCFIVEIIGLLLVGFADTPLLAKIGTFLTGAGFSLVFPALGVVAVKAVPQHNQGSALATYTVFIDLSLGVTGPLAGLLMAWTRIPVIYLAAAGLVMAALLLGWRLKKRPPVSEPEAVAPGQ